MIAIKGVYDNGWIQLTEKAPAEKASVIVIFPQDRSAENHVSERMARKLFDDFTGSISRDIDERSELMAARDEKYACSD